MSTVNVQTRVDPAIRNEADAVLKAIGLSVSDVVRMTLTRIAHDKAVPFELFRPNEATVAAFREAQAGNLKRFSSVADLMADLHADDNEDDAVQEGFQARGEGKAPRKTRRRSPSDR